LVLLLDELHVEAIVRHSNSVFPIEACGMLMGTFKTRIRIVKSVEPVENLVRSSSSYRMAPEELYRVLTDGEERGESLVGFYHSHPSWGAEPSKLDVELASFPKISYLIYSVVDRKLESYIWTDGRFEKERITISKRKTTAATVAELASITY